VPQLTTRPSVSYGWYVFSRGLTEHGNAYAAACVWTIGFAYGVLFLLDRRRKAHGWFAAQAATGGFYCVLSNGLTQHIFGTYDSVVLMIALTLAIYSSKHFTRTLFGLPAPSRVWLTPVVVTVVLSGFFYGPFQSTWRLAPVACLCVIAGVVSQLVVVGRLAFRPSATRPQNAIVVVCAWVLLGAFAAVDLFAWLGLGELFGGVRTACLGLTAYGLLQSVVLTRQHIVALRTGDALNAKLQAQVAHLADEQAKVRHLNEELRHQILVRSEQLSDALTRLVSTQSTTVVLNEGDVLDNRYRIRRPVGAGAMGTVYEAERVSDKRAFAIKVLAGNPGVHELARFAREAKLAASIDHPNVVRVFDAAVGTRGFLFVVFEYVNGKSLVAYRSRFGDVDWALAILAGVTRGLSAIHAAGIVHRDLKPANVLVREDARGQPLDVKITDFGISSSIGNSDRPSLSVAPPADGPSPVEERVDGWKDGEETRMVASSQSIVKARSSAPAQPAIDPLTQTGMVLGTPAYMAPEIMRDSRRSQPSSDIYCLGVLAFELVRGVRPFTDTESFDRAFGRLGSEPTFAGLGLGALLEGVLGRTLCLDPLLRPNAAELSAAIDAHLVAVDRRAPHPAALE
jgi:serine/threonine protein kinase